MNSTYREESEMAARRYAEDPDDPPDEHGAGISLDQILSLKEKFDGADLEGGGGPSTCRSSWTRLAP